MNRTQVKDRSEHTAVIRLAQAADTSALGEFFAALSLQSRYQRFFAPVTPSQATLRRMSGDVGGPDALVALHAGVIIGHAMAADHAGPFGERVTDVGVVVADTWQGQGVGSALVRELIKRAQARGVTSVTMDVLPGNQQVLAMITSHWTGASSHYRPDCVTVRARLPQRRQQRHRRTLSAQLRGSTTGRPCAAGPGTSARGSRSAA